MSDRFLYQRINVKLGKNASDNCAMLFEGYGGEAMKKSYVSEWHKQLKGNSHVEITNEDIAHHLITLIYIKCTGHFEFIPQGQTIN
jgi:hypothetical protein